MKKNYRKVVVAIAMLLVSAVMLGTASYAWFGMNTRSNADGLTVEAYTDSNFLQISKDGTTYNTDITYTENNTGLLRLITNKRFDASEMFTLVATAASDTHKGEATLYYKAVKADTGVNYVHVPMTDDDLASSTAGFYKNPMFTLVVAEGEAVDGVAYFKFVNNSYEIVSNPQGSVKGLYTADLVAEGAGAEYDGQSVYYKAVNQKELVKVTGLHLGTDLSQYYTVAATGVTLTENQKGDNNTEYYLKNGNDYSYVGAISNAELVKNYLYWGRAYSSDPTAVQADNTLNIIDKADAAEYYLQQTLYLQQAEGTNHATNLKIADIKVGGATNTLHPALRVLLVATSTSDPDNIVTVLYDAGEDTYNGQRDGAVLFETLLGNEAETIKVDVYIYFDGTDEISYNTTMVGAVLNGQSIGLEFAIDELPYNQ